MIAPALLLALQVAAPPGVPPDSIERLRSDARKAEATFERLSRRLVPMRYGVDGSNCDEIVGRFCLLYDTGRPHIPGPENGQVVDARREAIEALRAAFAWMPGDLTTAAPLVRYLVEDDRAREAASAARLYELESGDSLWGLMLRGFAEHASGRDSTSQHLFQRALLHMLPADRDRVLDLDWVIDAHDRGAYRKLDPEARAGFERTFWLLADPLYLTPGNESWNEHVARHVYSRMLERAPHVADMMRWGDDLEQLTIRYGVPVARTREPGRMMNDGPITEHYDPDQLAFTPGPVLRNGLPPSPLPGRPWELDRERSRTGYAPATTRRVVYLPHQVTRFPSADGATLRIDALFALDSVATGAVASVTTGFFALDLDGRITSITSDSAIVRRDTARLSFEIPLADEARLYSIEAMESVTGLAGRARYAIEPDTAALLLSDPLISFPWSPAPQPTNRTDPALRPRADLVVTKGDTLGLYAEAHGLSPAGPYRVRLSIEPASRGSLPGRVLSWLGDKLGLSEPQGPTRLEWTATASPGGSAVLAVELFPDADRNGDQVITLQVSDELTGRASVTRRIVRIGPAPDPSN